MQFIELHLTYIIWSKLLMQHQYILTCLFVNILTLQVASWSGHGTIQESDLGTRLEHLVWCARIRTTAEKTQCFCLQISRARDSCTPLNRCEDFSQQHLKGYFLRGVKNGGRFGSLLVAFPGRISWYADIQYSYIYLLHAFQGLWVGFVLIGFILPTFRRVEE